MKLDRLVDERQDLVAAITDRNAARKVRHVCTEGRWTLLDNDEISHVSYSAF
jgi:hypothetical protein